MFQTFQDIRTGVKVLTSGASYTVVNETLIVVNKTIGSATAIVLPKGLLAGHTLTVKDGKGDAATNNITLDGSGAQAIDGAPTLVVSSNYAAVTVVWNGTQWNCVGRFNRGADSGIASGS